MYADESRILVVTNDFIDGKVGLFESKDHGQSWKHFNEMNFSGSRVKALDNNLMYGSKSRGFWISRRKLVSDSLSQHIFEAWANWRPGRASLCC